jgi:hypothetical protein
MIHTPHTLSSLIRTAVLAGSIAFAASLPAQTPAWFPLAVGNTWLYRPVTESTRTFTGDFRSIRVHGKETIAGQEYFDVNFLGAEVLLRVEPSTGNVIEYDRTSNAERTWLALGAAVGTSFPTSIGPCPTSATIAARDASVTVPAGQFANAVQVAFHGNCVDVGLLQQFYAPYVGLASSEEETIFGPIRYELSYYHVGAVTGSGPEVSFTLALDAARYTAGSTLAARLTLRSTGADPIALQFPSGQSFDLKIVNEKGDSVFFWSAARSFTMIVRDETFGPGEETFGLTAPLANLPPGRYKAEAWLTTDPLVYLADVGFEIVAGQPPAPPKNRRSAFDR